MNLSNHVADQYCYAKLPIINELIDYLKPLGITHFAYTKFIDGDKCLLLCNCIPWVREKFGYSLDVNYIALPVLRDLQHNQEFSFWQSTYAYDNPVISGLRDYDVNHGIMFFRKPEKNIRECFHFATTNDNHLIYDFYLNNLDLLKGIVDCFMKKISDLIDHRKPGRLIKLEKTIEFSNDSRANINPDLFKENLMKELNLMDFTVYFNGKKIDLNKRLYSCYDLLRKGYTNKEIAKVLDKSHRTIDDYVSIIYNKLDIQSRRELITGT